MIRVPPEIAAELAGAVTAEREARSALRAAGRRQAALLRRLRDNGIPFTAAALARALGEAGSPEVRRRLAARLRQRVRRATALVTERHVELEAGSPQVESGLLPVVEREEAPMAEKTKLVRRTITEEVYASPDLDAEIEDTDEDEVEDEDDDSDEDDSPRKRKNR